MEHKFIEQKLCQHLSSSIHLYSISPAQSDYPCTMISFE
jgi:hypothetical protein